MKVIQTGFPNLIVIEPDVFGDNRGWFFESYSYQKYSDLGINQIFVQDNHSFSSEKGTLRGLHFQTGDKAQSKLIRCVKGRLMDVCVDLRIGSPSYKQVYYIELSEQNKKQLFVPKGFAHGFITLSDNVEIEYKVDQLYSKEHDSGIRYDDPTLNINWREFVSDGEFTLSQKDLNLKNIDETEIGFRYE